MWYDRKMQFRQIGGDVRQGLRAFSFGLVFVAALYLPLCLFPAPDLRLFDYDWLDHIRAAGLLGAFAAPFSNYTPPYLYLLAAASTLGLSNLMTVKLISLIGAAWLAFCVARFCKSLGGDPRIGAYRTLILPTVILNAPILGQCDAFWAGCCILAVADAVLENPFRMALWAGLGFAFKAQAAFLAPFCLGYIIGRRAWSALAIPPAIYLLAVIPAAAAGWPLTDLLTIYLRQMQFPNAGFIGDAPNLWAIPSALGAGPSILPIGYALGAAGAIYVVMQRKPGLLDWALLSAALIPFLLPKMLNRFFFLADVLSLAIACTRKDRTSIVLVVLIQGGSILSIMGYLDDLKWLNVIAFLPMAAAVGYMVYASSQTAGLSVTENASAGEAAPLN